MKLLLVAPILVFINSLIPRVDAWQLRRVTTTNRHLEEGYDVIVSDASSQNNPLCITAVGGTESWGSVELLSCNFDNTPPEQLWLRQGNKFVSAVENGNRCMSVNHGTNLFDGVRIRLGNCNDGLTDFTWNDGKNDQLRVLSNTNYCLTPTGSTASSGDRIHAKPCLDRLDYKWTFNPPATNQDDGNTGGLYQLYAPGVHTCVQPEDHNDPAAAIILDVCDDKRAAWHVKETPSGVKFSSALDPTLCLQAGFCHAQDGTWMRLMDCDEENGLQDFDWQDYEAPIKLADNDSLCMVWQGRSAEAGDIVIMKDCAARTYEWSGDAIE